MTRKDVASPKGYNSVTSYLKLTPTRTASSFSFSLLISHILPRQSPIVTVVRLYQYEYLRTSGLLDGNSLFLSFEMLLKDEHVDSF